MNPGPSAAPNAFACRFLTTQWGVVLAAAREGAHQPEALEHLCRTYWYPIYAHIRRRGNDPEDARDLTQEFFARLLEKHWLADIQVEGGRFRSFLLTAVDRFLSNHYDQANAMRRGGGQGHISLDADWAEGRYHLEPVTGVDASPVLAFDRRWANTILERALQRLQEEVTSSKKERYFSALSPFLSREPRSGEYTAIGEALGLTAGAVGVATHRLRHRYRELVRQEVTVTLMDPREIEDELRHLFACLLAIG